MNFDNTYNRYDDNDASALARLNGLSDPGYDQDEVYKGVAQLAPEFNKISFRENSFQPYFGQNTCQKESIQPPQVYPKGDPNTMNNYVTITSCPDDVLQECIEFLEELNMKECVLDLYTGNLNGFYFEDAKNVRFSLQIRGQMEGELFLDASRMSGDGFVFFAFWKALRTHLCERGHTLEDFQEEELSWDFLEESDDEDMEDLDLGQVKYLRLSECSETLKYMISDMKDPNFRETCASTLAFNSEDMQNREAMMGYGQQLFDALIASILCSMATCYFAQLPFYRSAAQLLDAVLGNNAVQMVSEDQYEALVAATKKWAFESRQHEGEITCSEQIATMLSKQLARCAPRLVTQKAQEDLCSLNDSPFHLVQQHAQAALSMVAC